MYLEPKKLEWVSKKLFFHMCESQKKKALHDFKFYSVNLILTLLGFTYSKSF